MDLNFLMIFIVLSLFFYIVFYYLGNTRENYSDYNKFYTHNYHSYDNLNNHILRDHLEESEHIEEENGQKEYKNHQIGEKINQEEYRHNFHQIEKEVSNIHPSQIQEEEVNKIPYNEIIKPDINKILLENPEVILLMESLLLSDD